MTQDDPLARFFYETECIKGTWSVKELRRQISTNLYFRSGVSKDPKKLLASIKPEQNTAALTIHQPFAFEFLGLNAKDVVTESDLEDALITHLQDFLLELGKKIIYHYKSKNSYYMPLHKRLVVISTNFSSTDCCLHLHVILSASVVLSIVDHLWKVTL